MYITFNSMNEIYDYKIALFHFYISISNYYKCITKHISSALCQKGLNPMLGVIELLISPCIFHHSLINDVLHLLKFDLFMKIIMNFKRALTRISSFSLRQKGLNLHG